MRTLRSALIAVSVLLVCAASANAQHIDAYFGMGTVTDPSSNQVFDSGTGTLVSTPEMDGLFGMLGLGLMFTPSFGLGIEGTFRFAQDDCVDFGYRPIFYDFNGVYTPTLGSDRVMAEFQGGLGGVNLTFYGGQEYCDYYTGQCSNYVGSINRFALHAAVGLRIYVLENIFLRPQFDYRWVPNLNEQFKRNSVLGYTLAIGYSSSQ